MCRAHYVQLPKGYSESGTNRVLLPTEVARQGQGGRTEKETWGWGGALKEQREVL